MTTIDTAVTVTIHEPRTAAQRKRDQRRRDRAALYLDDGPLDAIRTTVLVEALPVLIGAAPHALASVLTELGRRGGVTVTAQVASERKANRDASVTRNRST